MAEDADSDQVPKPSRRMPLVLGLALGMAMAGAGFAATYFGIIGGDSKSSGATDQAHAPSADVAFLPIEPIMVTLAQGNPPRNLRLRAELEIEPTAQESVAKLMPRVLDVLNSYLRAVEMAELEKPTSLIYLRTQLLRRIQLVVGEGRVRDLLVTEFVLN